MMNWPMPGAITGIGHEHHEDQRHDLGHLPAVERVAHDGDGDDARGRRADALHEARHSSSVAKDGAMATPTAATT